MIDAPQEVALTEDSNGVASELRRMLIGQFQSGGAKDGRPSMAAAFDPFKDQVKYRWDDKWLYLESNGLPTHNMMVGISNWQQQVPLPKSYFGTNAWQIPLHPTPSKNPVSIKGRFLRGAIAVAVNGIPIFNPQNNRGDVSQEIGELDQWGGHCGRGDDYHYHAAPIFLEKTVGPGKPIAFALDGYPIYGSTGPDGSPVDGKTLDAFHGKTDAKGNYAYYASTKYPYLNGGFHGEVTEVGGQVDPQPSGHGIRPALQPLRGARITGFKRSPDNKTFSLEYKLGTETCYVNYAINADGSVKFDFIDGQGQVRTETYSPRGEAGRLEPAGGAPPPRQEGTNAQPNENKRVVEAVGKAPFTNNKDGTVTDNFTGLIWQKVDNGESTWDQAVANASTLHLGGYSDWRLPTQAELISLANHGYNPAIDLNYFPSNPKSPAGYWWTSQARGNDRVWVVNRGGGTGAKPKNETISAGGTLSYNARYVRGTRRGETHHYADNKDGTVTDIDSGLMWAQTAGPSVTWEAAKNYAKGITIGGYNDWRLPDVKELASLIDFDILNFPELAGGVPCIDRTFFPQATAASYWTATKLHSPTGGEAWYVDFAGGNLRYETLSKTNPAFGVRTVTPAASLPVGPNSYFHPEDAPTDQPAWMPTGGGKGGGPPGRAARGGGNEPPGDLHLMPREVEEKLNLTNEQRKQIEDLTQETKGKLEKILTAGQMEILDESRPPRPSN